MTIDVAHLSRAIEAAIAAKWIGISDFDLAGAYWETDGPGPHEIRVDCLINLTAMVTAVIEVDRGARQGEASDG